MGCTREAIFRISGDWLIREERIYERGRLATETMAVERLAAAAP